MADAFEILSDCPTCRVEGAVVELHDPGRASGVAVVARCRLCRREERLGREHHPGQVPRDEAEATAALVRWAEEEGVGEVALFCESSFSGLPQQEVVRRLLTQEPVPTNFDVLSWLFGGFIGGAAPPEPARHEPAATTPSVAAPSASPPLPFHAGRALASVMLADGDARPSERAWVDRTLERMGQPPLQPADLRVWWPMELGRPDDPAPWVDAMARLAWSDGVRDETEWRVVREFARAWGYSMKRLERLDRRLEATCSPLPHRLWLGLRALFVEESS